MASVYASTSETTNANRACRVVLGPCTDGLRDLLRHHVPPHTFPNVIKQNKLNLPRLTAVQRDLILPKHGGYSGIYDDMDISLLYILLRNITNISPHSKGWGNDPDPHDTSLSANVERIRLVRNRCVHSCDPSMSNKNFNSIWSTIRSTMVDLDAFLMNGNKYEKAVDFLRHESMDPKNDLYYEKELRKQVEEDKTTREMVDNLENKLEKLTKSPVPQNVREQYDIDIEKWREEDKLYYKTHSFPSMMEKVRNQPCVTFVGVPGSGKSATAHHIALKLQEEGYEVVPVDEIREIKQYCDTKNPQVFVIDDVVGVFGLQKTKLDVLTDYEQKVTQPCMIKSRTLMTCREDVFNETLPYKPFLTKEETVIKLHSSDHALDDNDKKQILQKYGLNVNLISPALLTSASHMFPLLCKLFSKETKFQALGSKFFLNPAQCIIDELDNMQRHNKLNYVTLVLCMLNENSLSKDNFEHKKFIDKKKNTLENCRLELNTDTFKFMDALSAMEGTYTKQCDAQYTFIHDSMFEICAYQYGKQFPDQMLQYMSSSYIAYNVKTQASEPGIVDKVKEKQNDSRPIEGRECSSDSDEKMKHSDSQPIKGRESSEGKEKESDDKNNEGEESSDLCIRLCEDQYPLLAERLYRDIQNMELYDVFRNQVLKHPQVCQAFIGVLEKKSYAELKALFLSSQGEEDKIASKRERVEEEGERSEWQRQEVLIGRNKRKGETNRKYNVRVVRWVIYYGHYQIIEYIVQQTEQHNEVSELFGTTGNCPQESRSEMERSGIETCNNQENNRPVEQSTSGIYTCNKQESEINRLVEEHRLLVLSCYSGDIQTVRVLLPVCRKAINGIGQVSEDIDCCHDTPLTAACVGGHVSIMEELVKAGADVNLQDRRGNTPLIAACKGGHVSIVEELVKAGADVNLQNDYGNTPLIAACKGGHVSVVEELVKAGADVNLQNDYGNTPLIAACDEGHVSIVEELMKAGADVNLQDDDGNTPLIAACKGGHVSIVEELMKVGADVNLQDRLRNTPLTAACKGGHVSIVEELMKAGADVNLQDRRGNTPLTAACKGGHVSIVEELMKAGADVNLQDRRGNTPLIAACDEGHVSIVEELVKAGADVNLQDRRGNTPLIAACKGGHVSIVEELMKVGADVNLQDRLRNTPLTAACKGGHVSIVEELMKAGADVNLQDRRGNTPLTAACKGGHASIAEELVKAGTDVNLQDDMGNTPLIAACDEGHVSIVEELVKAGADVNLQDRRGNTPLIAACKGGHVSIVEELMKVGADVNLQDRLRNTPLTAACKGGHVSIVEELMKAGADVNLQDRRGNTPLTAACKGGHVSIVEELMKAGADVNLQDDYGNTPLTAACEGGHVSIVEELVKAGADVNLQNDYGNTPLTAACEGGHVSIVEELVKAGADVNLQNDYGNTPLIAACKGGHVSIVEELMKVGADVNLRGKGGNTPLIAACKGGHVSIVEELMKVGADVNLQGKGGNTPLIAACKGGHVSIVEELMKVGADVNLRGKGGNTPLIAACKGGHVSIVEELVKAGADVNLQDRLGNTPLIAACVGGHVSIVEELMKAGADVNLQDDYGNTPLIAACKGGHVSIVEELMKVGADVNLRGKGGNTPLKAACERGHESIVEELVKAGADVNLQEDYRNTPLTAACGEGHVSIVKELVKAGADVSLQDDYGNTPLIAACKEGHVSIVDELVKAGADVNLQNIMGDTPLIAACKEGHVSVVEELVKAGADVSLQDDYGNTPLIAACKEGHASIAEELVKAGTDVNLQDDMGNTPLTAACEEGHVSIVKELVKAGADVNLQDRLGNTPLIAAVRKCPLSTVKYLVEHGADWVTQVVNIYVSAVYKALILNKPDIMKYLIQEQNKITPGTFNGNVHLFNCLVDIRHAGVKTDSRDDVVVTDRIVWCMYRQGDLWRTISRGDCDVLRHLLCVGLDVNQSIQLYDMFNDYKPGVTPLLYTLIDENGINVSQIMEKVRILLGAGVDVNIRVRYREYDTVLDREGVSVLERTRRLVCKYSNNRSMFKYSDRVPEYKRVMCEIKKHVRRHSV
ncbi:uncharacterized protein LOC125653998 isoform X1 [Ostrea edulis]|uniref:uncharacterized protein LOC125653998 isoform X1 n=2 Tax=Ostrea edulis TaxID=37623 RepID=UPI0024AEC94A|nr:uncharacterized protein LOC125653998 isoform X1 [Ostrea edulis]XP_055998779.1 uncharacterized protein LOC125653998 isoform X1 [Ostrea edulis]XP_055998780.1 uncharacterized protein LOC125653998 isoform X1 [Ostrea edulis]XP_055998781.1 uncharacterized protein LOC125653998 isoform X1 [Ostrea edulis]